MKKETIRTMCLTGFFTAIVFVVTAYLHIPSHTGYTHVGDAFIFLAACLLPTPYAVFVGAGGAALADCLGGFALWAPGSVLIKALTVLFFTRKGKILSLRNLLALIPALVLCAGGYYCYEALITGNWIAPAAGIPGYLTQWMLSAVLFLILGAAGDRLGLKQIVQNGGRKS